MAVNRFMKSTPIDFSNTPIYEPNWDFINETLAAQQEFYDKGVAASELPIDAYGAQDITRAGEITDFRRETMEKISDIYATQGVNAGNKALKALTQQIQRDYTDPNSLVYKMQESAKGIREFMSKVDEWEVPSEYRDYMKNMTSELWQGTVGADGQINSFSAPSLSAYADVPAMALEAAQLIEPEVLEQVYHLRKDDAGYYYDTVKNVRLKPGEVATRLKDMLMTDPKVMNWMRQANTLEMFNQGITKDNMGEAIAEHNAVVDQKLMELSIMTDDELEADFPGQTASDIRKARIMQLNDMKKPQYWSWDDMMNEKISQDLDAMAGGVSGIFEVKEKYIVRSRINENANSRGAGKSTSDIQRQRAAQLFAYDNTTIITTLADETPDIGLEDGGTMIRLHTGVVPAKDVTFDMVDKELQYMNKDIDTKTDAGTGMAQQSYDLLTDKGINVASNPFSLNVIDTDGDGVGDKVEYASKTWEEAGITDADKNQYHEIQKAYADEALDLQNRIDKKNNLQREVNKFLAMADSEWQQKLIDDPDITKRLDEQVEGITEAYKAITANPDVASEFAENADEIKELYKAWEDGRITNRLEFEMELFELLPKGMSKHTSGTQGILDIFDRDFWTGNTDEFLSDVIQPLIKSGYLEKDMIESLALNKGATVDESILRNNMENKKKDNFEKRLFTDFMKRYDDTMTQEAPIIPLNSRNLTGEAVDEGKQENFFRYMMSRLNWRLNEDTPDVTFLTDATTLSGKGKARQLNRITLNKKDELELLKNTLGQADANSSDFAMIFDTRQDRRGWYMIYDLRDEKGKELGFERKDMEGNNQIMLKVDESMYGLINDTFGLDLAGTRDDVGTMMDIDEQFDARGFFAKDISVGPDGEKIRITATKDVEQVDNWRTNDESEIDHNLSYKVKINGYDVNVKSDYDLMKAVNDMKFLKGTVDLLSMSGQSQEQIVDAVLSQSTIASIFPGDEDRQIVQDLVAKVSEASAAMQSYLPEGFELSDIKEAISMPETGAYSNQYAPRNPDGTDPNPNTWGKYQFRHQDFKNEIMNHYLDTKQIEDPNDWAEARALFESQPEFQEAYMDSVMEDHLEAASRIITDLGFTINPKRIIHLIHYMGEGGAKQYLQNQMVGGSEFAEQQFQDYSTRNNAQNLAGAEYTKRMMEYLATI